SASTKSPTSRKGTTTRRTPRKAATRQRTGTEQESAAVMGPLDLHLFGEGKHERVYEKLGAHPVTHQGVKGVSFAVWAPAAEQVGVVGNFNAWDGTSHLMSRLGNSGVWQTFIPKLDQGELYKYEIKAPGTPAFLKADPYAFYAEAPPNTSSIVYESKYRFRDSS